MSNNLDRIVKEIRDVRAKKRPDIEKNLQKIESLLAALRRTRDRASKVAGCYPDLKSALSGISFSDAENSLLAARAACEAALVRLRRDSINIGVAGKARQGKSQILQMLTGLGDEQIPTGDGGFCTASRSIVRNASSKSAIVHYLAEGKLLEEKVAPSFAPLGSNPVALGLSSRPASIDAFIKMELPSVPDTAPVEALENWKKVVALQKDLRENRGLIAKLGASPETVKIDTVRKYLVKDNGEADYQVVDHVEIHTSFEMNLPKGMTVYDLPGLEDPTPGIREMMLKSVSEDADIVLLLRMPKNTGDDWDSADLRTMNMLKNVYPADDVLPKDWIQLVLNLDKRDASHNEKQVERMKESAPSGFSPVVCDCGSKDDVRAMVDRNIDALVKQAANIDDLRIRQAENKKTTAIHAASALYDALRNASGDIVAQESGFEFERYLLEFMAELRGPMKRDMSSSFQSLVEEVLSRHFKTVEKKLYSFYDQYENAYDFPNDLPVFSKKRIKNEFDAGHGPVGVVEKTVRNQREAVLKLIRNHLTDCCGELVARYFDCVIENGLGQSPSLSRISELTKNEESSKECLTRFLSRIRDTGSYASLEEALEGLLRFDLSFDETVLPAIYSIPDLDDFNPELPLDVKKERYSELDDIKRYIGNIQSSEEQSTALYNWLRQKSESILSGITSGSDSSPLAKVFEHVANTMRANYDAFVFRFIWGDTCDNEWRRLADRNKSVFWKREFDVASANSKLAKDWQSALSELSSAL